jgi:hypothetical protein
MTSGTINQTPLIVILTLTVIIIINVIISAVKYRRWDKLFNRFNQLHQRLLQISDSRSNRCGDSEMQIVYLERVMSFRQNFSENFEKRNYKRCVECVNEIEKELNEFEQLFPLNPFCSPYL